MNLNELLATAEYTGLTDAEAAALANEKRHTARVMVPLSEISQKGRAEGWWYGLLAAEATSQNAQAFLEYYRDQRFTNLDLDLPASGQILAGLVSDGVITQEIADSVDSLANRLESDVERHGLGTVEEKHVRWERE